MPSRRAFLAALSAGLVPLTGCGDQQPTTATRTASATATDSPTATASPTASDSPTPTDDPTPKDVDCDRRWDPADRWMFGGNRDVEAVAAGAENVFAATENAVIAIDPSTGKSVWRTGFETEGFGVRRLLPAGATLLAVGYRTVVALSADAGRQEWSFTVPGKEQTADVVADATAVVGDTLYLGAVNESTPSFAAEEPYSRLYAVEAESGDARRVRAFASDDSTPAPRHLEGDESGLFCSLGGRFVALDPDGTLHWRSDPVDDGYGSPVIADETVLVPDGGAVTAFAATDGRRRWRDTELEPALGVGDGMGYAAPRESAAAGGVLAAFDPRTGEHRWEAEVSHDGSVPVVDGGTVFRTTEGENAALTAYDAERGCRLGRIELPAGSWRAPVVGTGRVSVTGGEWQAWSLRSFAAP